MTSAQTSRSPPQHSVQDSRHFQCSKICATKHYYKLFTSTPTNNTTEPSIKKEELSALFSESGKTIIEALNMNANRPCNGNTGNGTSNTGNQTSSTLRCIMCGGLHFGRDCSTVKEFIKAGKCRRNHEGKVVLPSGAFVSCDTLGCYLCQRIDKWHRQNPNQLAAATLIHTISQHILTLHTTSAGTLKSTPDSIYQLSTTDRITTLEAELFNLCAWKPPIVTRPWTRAQRAREPVVEIDEEEDLPPRGQQRARIEEVIEENPVWQPTLETIPEHLFRNAKDAIYMPPVIKSIRAEDKNNLTTAKRPEPAYKTLPPVHDPAIANNVYK